MNRRITIDPGMVIDYMKKYVTKSEMSNNRACGRLIKSILHKTVEGKVRSVKTLLRLSMSKLIVYRIILKQEICYLMIGIPTVHCIHTEVNIDLRKNLI